MIATTRDMAMKAANEPVSVCKVSTSDVQSDQLLTVVTTTARDEGQ